MTNRKNTRRALVMSALSLLLCCAMLVGTTFAWFTDSVESGKNTIIAGNLDIELDYATKIENGQVTEWTNAQGKADIFDPNALWEPGRVEVAYLRVTNAGTLALKYQLGINVASETAGKNVAGEEFKLSDHLVFQVVEMPDAVTVYGDREAAKLASTGTEKGLKDYNGSTTTLDPKDAANCVDYVALIIYMPESVGNEANYREVMPKIELGVNLYATQVEAEDDSFGTDYDKDAWNTALKVNTPAELYNAIDQVEEGGTIVLGAGMTFDANNNIDAGDGWIDGVHINGDKSFTIDLNGQTLTNDSAINDYILFIKNVGSKPNVITLKNGTLDASSSAYSALCVSGTSTQKTTINLENMTLIGNHSNGSVAKIRSGAELNVLPGTVINGKNSYLAIEAWKATINVYEGAEIYQNGTGSYNGCLVGVGGNSVANIYGGYGKSVSGCFIAMTSGGTINVYGGEWIANTDGTVAHGSNKGALVAQSDNRAKSIINVYGGTFKGGYCVYGNVAGDAQLNISGGNFNANPSAYVVADHAATQNADGTWTVDREYTVVTPATGATAADNGAALANAINTSATPYIQLGAGEYKMPSVSGNKEFTIVGTEDTVVDITMGAYMDGATVSFEGVTIKGSTGMANGNGSDYAALYTPNVTYTNCTFDGPFRIGRDGATFIGCTFTNLGNDYVWTYGNDCTFENCTFNTEGKALLIYSDGGNEVSKVTVKNCTFNSTKGGTAWAIANQNCAAIEIQNYGNGVDLVTSGNTFDSNFSGEWRIKSYHAAQPAVIINGTTYTTIAVDGKPMTIDADRNVTIQ